MAVQTKHIDMCNGPIFKNAIIYTIPIILTGLLQLLFNAADLMVVGWFSGSNSVGAVGATGSMTNLLINLFMGMSSGVSVVTAKAIGAKKARDTARIVHTAVPMGLLAGAFLTVLGLFLAEPMLKWMDTPTEILPLSTLYVRIYFCGMIPNLGFNFCAAILRAAGDTKSPMKFLTISGVINVLLNVIFVAFLKMDVAGVALATIIAQTVSFLLVLTLLIRRDDDCKLEWKKLHIEPKALKSILRVGLPAGIQSSVFSLSNVIIQSSINSFGATAVSGNAAAGNLEGFVYIAMNAFYQTSLNFTGQNVGAGKMDRVLKVLRTCILSAVSIGAVLSMVFRFFAPQLLSFYIADDMEAISYGVIRMSFVCQFYFMCGAMEVLSGALRGMGASVITLFIAILGVCGVRLGWIFTVFRMEAYHTLESLYFSYIISWLMCIFAQSIAFVFVYKKQKKLHQTSV